MDLGKASALFSALGFRFNETEVDVVARRVRVQPDPRRALFLAKKMRVDYVFNAAALEGNPFTYPEVKTLVEGVTVGGRKQSDAEQVMNLNRALSRLIELVETNQFQFNKSIACELHGLVAREEALTWGQFRNSAVFIGNTSYVPPPAHSLIERFEQGRTVLDTVHDPVLRAFLVFLWGALCQFFHDGNKRTARFLANGILLSNGLPPLLLLAADQLDYNQTMNDFYETQDATQALHWLYKVYGERLERLGLLVR